MDDFPAQTEPVTLTATEIQRRNDAYCAERRTLANPLVDDWIRQAVELYQRHVDNQILSALLPTKGCS